MAEVDRYWQCQKWILARSGLDWGWRERPVVQRNALKRRVMKGIGGRGSMAGNEVDDWSLLGHFESSSCVLVDLDDALGCRVLHAHPLGCLFHGQSVLLHKPNK